MTECLTDLVQAEALKHSKPIQCERCGTFNDADEPEAVNCWKCSEPLRPIPASAPVTCCVWWNSEAAEKGTPWAVRHHDGTVSYFAAIRITGTVEFVLRPPDKLLELPGGPRGVAVLIDGTLLGGR